MAKPDRDLDERQGRIFAGAFGSRWPRLEISPTSPAKARRQQQDETGVERLRLRGRNGKSEHRQIDIALGELL